jgi:hypothetical protein
LEASRSADLVSLFDGVHSAIHVDTASTSAAVSASSAAAGPGGSALGLLACRRWLQVRRRQPTRVHRCPSMLRRRL